MIFKVPSNPNHPLILQFYDNRAEKGQIEIRCKEEVLHCEGGEALEQVAQEGCGCSIPGSVQSQVGWSLQQPDLVGGVPAVAGGLELDDL